jgi:lysophospholipase L1-like esterase
LEAVDFTAVDVVTISYGTNDWSSQVTPDQYEAALTDGITRLGTAYPNLLFVICTPIIRFKHSDDSGDDDAEDSGGESEGTGAIISSDTIESSSGYKLPQYAEKVEAVCHAMHCPVCENYWSLGINLQNYTTFMGGMAEADLVHPNAKGRRLIANHLADALIRL